MGRISDLSAVLAAAVDARRLPGASAAVLADGEVTEGAAGVLSTATEVECTTDSLFQIGSITKVYTATLVMQLVEQGLLDLDEPVVTYLPEFEVADATVTKRVTPRHLLTHTSGFDGGDHFFDAGRGDDALTRYVASLAVLGQLSEPGAHWSYNNAGFGVLGRLIEVVTGEVWDVAIRTRLLEPAGLTRSVTLPEEVLLHRAAVGHQAGPDGSIAPVRAWWIGRSAGPAGGVCATASDVVGFARLHLEDGREVLSPSSVKAMQTEQVVMPGGAASFGLGWMLRDLDGVRCVSHNGGTLGQGAFLAAFPDHGVALSLLTNGPTGALVWKDVAAHVTSALGLPSLDPAMPTPPDEPVALDLERYVARYERRAVHTTIRRDGDHLVAEMAYVDIPYDLTPPPPLPLTAVDAGTFVALTPDGTPAMDIRFLDFDGDGRPQLLFASRLARRAT